MRKQCLQIQILFAFEVTQGQLMTIVLILFYLTYVKVFFHHPYTFPKLKEKITGSAVMAWKLCYWESKTTVADKEEL